MIHYFKIITLSVCALFLVACGKSEEESNTIKVGTISGPETQLMEVAKRVAKDEYNVEIKIVPFSDYAMPNIALSDGSLDANVFQHLPYLEQTNKARGFDLVSIGETFIYPMGIYSKKYQSVNAVQAGAKIAIPNDPTNEARALLLLQKSGLIKLAPQVTVTASVNDILENPLNLRIKPLKAGQLPRVLDDVDLAVINTNYAIPAGLVPTTDAIFLEDQDSLYANIIVIRAKDLENENLKILVKALHSKQVQDAAKDLFQDQAIVAWED